MTSPPTGTITFLFTDIEGSTRLWENHPEPMRLAVARHDALLRQAVERNGGYLFKTTGDGITAAFAVAADGLAAALAAQQALDAEPWDEPVAILARMGLHTGAAELRDGDYFGPALNRCARLMAAGHGGQTLLSEVTQELCRDALPLEASLLTLGEHRLKDLARPETIYQLQHPTLTTSFSPLRTLDNPALPNNLPRQVTSFVGREKDITAVTALLRKTSFLTLTGSGGSGKTRLSLQVAADILEDYPDGAWQVELASVLDPILVPQTVASALGLREQSGQTILQTLIDSLKSKRLLLLLDNAEHLLSACATLVAAVLRSCPDLKVLVTSREPLGIAGELTYRIPVLSLPGPKEAGSATAQSLSQYEAVRLFIDRAVFVKPDFAATNANAPALAQLCYRLDGIPLAIELAAARVRSLTVEQINERLDSRFSLLTGGDRSALPRQQTLRALVDWSYDLLTEVEKVLLGRLSVFAGGWALQAAEAVCGFAPIEDWEVLDLLTSLVDKSLLVVETEESARATRYRMLETLRQYANEKLADEAAKVRDHHRDFFLTIAEEANSKREGLEQIVWLNNLELEHDNMRAALAYCLDTTQTDTDALDPELLTDAELDPAEYGLRLAGALAGFWRIRGYLAEGRAHFEKVLRPLVGRVRTEPVARALRQASSFAFEQGDYETARLQLEEALAIHRELGDKKAIARDLDALSTFPFNQRNYEASKPFCEEALAIRLEIGDESGIAISLRNLGDLASGQGDYQTARLHYQDSFNRYEKLGDKSDASVILLALGHVAYVEGNNLGARRLFEESVSRCRELHDEDLTAYALMCFGWFLWAEGDYSTANLILQENLSICREQGAKDNIARALLLLGENSEAQNELGTAQAYCREALAIFNDLGTKRGIAESLYNLANAAHGLANYSEARVLYVESLLIYRTLGLTQGLVVSIEGLATLFISQSLILKATILFGAAQIVREKTTMPPRPQVKQSKIQNSHDAARSSLGDEAFDAAWNEGHALSLDEAIDLALGGGA